MQDTRRSFAAFVVTLLVTLALTFVLGVVVAQGCPVHRPRLVSCGTFHGLRESKATIIWCRQR